MNCIAVDDEQPALDLIERDIKRIPFLKLCGKYYSAAEALRKVNGGEIDLVFLDIQMPDIDGIQFIRSLTKKPLFILTTAYDQYALEGFDLDVVDYLLKPIPFDRFLKAANKANELFTHSSYRTDRNTRDFIFIRSDYQQIRVFVDDILYIEGLKDYVKVHVKNMSKPILTLQSIRGFEERLPSSGFIRVHKSFLVALDKIDSVRKSRITIGSAEIPVSDSHKDAFDRLIQGKNR